MSPDKNLAAKLRELLDRLADSRKLSNEEQEEIHDAVIAEARLLSGEGFLEALDSVVEKSKSRRQESVYLLCEFAHLPKVTVRIAEEFKNPDPKWRHWLIQMVGLKQMVQLAPNLTAIIEGDPDIQCRRSAIWSAGVLRADCCLPIILKLAENPPIELQSSLTWALKDYCTPAARTYFERLFKGRYFLSRILQNKSVEKGERIIAAWGLGKLGDRKAIEYLIKMMFDPDKRTATSSSHGQSMRAAQAICNIKGWDFQWNKNFVHSHRDGWRKAVLADLESKLAA